MLCNRAATKMTGEDDTPKSDADDQKSGGEFSNGAAKSPSDAGGLPLIGLNLSVCPSIAVVPKGKTELALVLY